MASLHPAFVVLCLSGLVIFWLTPISAWWMLSGERHSNARIWFTGTALYALVASLVVFSKPVPREVLGPLAGGLSMTSLLCMWESLRRELSDRATPLRAYAWVLVTVVGLLSWFYADGFHESAGLAAQLILLSGVELALIWHTNLVRRRLRSKSLWLILFMLGMFAASNLYRMVEAWQTGHVALLMEFTTASRVSLMVNFLSVVFYSYGYWGFVVEKNRALLLQAHQQVALAREAERLALVGQLAQAEALSATIAHEINQPLTVIQLNADESQRLAAMSGASESLQALLASIGKNNLHVAQIVQRVRTLFRQKTPLYTTQVLDDLVLLVVEMRRAKLERASIALKLDLAAPAGFECAGTELEHILVNLLDNAVDALEAVPASERELTVRTWHEEGWVCLSVEDNGEGVPKSLQAHVFELGHSNKREGMGVGLWLAQHIVERHRGSITLDPLRSRGACFTVKLPDRQTGTGADDA